MRPFPTPSPSPASFPAPDIQPWLEALQALRTLRAEIEREHRFDQAADLLLEIARKTDNLVEKRALPPSSACSWADLPPPPPTPTPPRVLCRRAPKPRRTPSRPRPAPAPRDRR
ncbi:MAG: hypothetical protein IPJ41_04440 [Phycisphaerales bacterium]|nr:hypothetical protein [Phycisphaerales bacterium]